MSCQIGPPSPGLFIVHSILRFSAWSRGSLIDPLLGLRLRTAKWNEPGNFFLVLLDLEFKVTAGRNYRRNRSYKYTNYDLQKQKSNEMGTKVLIGVSDIE